MLGYVSSVSQYIQFYDWDLDQNQVLPRPYWGSFEAYIGEKSYNKMGVRLGRSIRNSCLVMCWKKDNKEILVYIETKPYNGERKNTVKIHNWGNIFYLYGGHWR